jgi:hypothetical protein
MIFRTVLRNENGIFLMQATDDPDILCDDTEKLEPDALVDGRRAYSFSAGATQLVSIAEESVGNELFYRDQYGKKQDAALWAELLGEDLDDTFLADPTRSAERPPS